MESEHNERERWIKIIFHLRTIYRNGMMPKLVFSLRILLLHNGHFSGTENEKIFAPQCCVHRMPGSVAIVRFFSRIFITYSALCWLPSGTTPRGIANYMLIESSRAPKLCSAYKLARWIETETNSGGFRQHNLSQRCFSSARWWLMNQCAAAAVRWNS